MAFKIVGPISQQQTIAADKQIREIGRLRRVYGQGRWRIGTRHMESAARNSRSNASLVSDSTSRNAGHLFALCVDNRKYPASLERCKVYRVIKDSSATRHRLLRIIDESGQSYLYPESCFVTGILPKRARKAFAPAS